MRGRLNLRGLKEIAREWVKYYNAERPHQASGYRTPDEVYYGEVAERIS